MKITVIDKYLIKEFIKYALLTVLCVVAIYQLIDLFDELDYFASRHVSFFTVALYYLYSTPQAVSLLLPVGIILSCFFVYGILTRERSIQVFQSAGINIYRLFAPIIAIGVLLIFVQFFGYECITIPAGKKLSDLKRNKIERRQARITTKRNNLYVRGQNQTVFYIKEYESEVLDTGLRSGIMKDFIIIQLSNSGKFEKRVDGGKAVYENNHWFAHKVNERIFVSDSVEEYNFYDTLTLDIFEKPGDFTDEVRAIEEMSVWELKRLINQLRIAGAKTATSEVEYHFRFSASFIGIILILLGLPLAVRLKKGGVMFGLGLGLLFSFIYWGLLQVTRAFGQVSLMSPLAAAWISNLVFLVVDIYLMFKIKQ